MSVQKIETQNGYASWRAYTAQILATEYEIRSGTEVENIVPEPLSFSQEWMNRLVFVLT